MLHITPSSIRNALHQYLTVSHCWRRAAQHPFIDLGLFSGAPSPHPKSHVQDIVYCVIHMVRLTWLYKGYYFSCFLKRCTTFHPLFLVLLQWEFVPSRYPSVQSQINSSSKKKCCFLSWCKQILQTSLTGSDFKNHYNQALMEPPWKQMRG